MKTLQSRQIAVSHDLVLLSLQTSPIVVSDLSLPRPGLRDVQVSQSRRSDRPSFLCDKTVRVCLILTRTPARCTDLTGHKPQFTHYLIPHAPLWIDLGPQIIITGGCLMILILLCCISVINAPRFTVFMIIILSLMSSDRAACWCGKKTSHILHLLHFIGLNLGRLLPGRLRTTKRAHTLHHRSDVKVATQRDMTSDFSLQNKIIIDC